MRNFEKNRQIKRTITIYELETDVHTFIKITTVQRAKFVE